MGPRGADALNLSLALKLGRISNLPTVWTNVLVGALLAGGNLLDARMPMLMNFMAVEGTQTPRRSSRCCDIGDGTGIA